jgi:hypothetical protein
MDDEKARTCTTSEPGSWQASAVHLPSEDVFTLRRAKKNDQAIARLAGESGQMRITGTPDPARLVHLEFTSKKCLNMRTTMLKSVRKSQGRAWCVLAPILSKAYSSASTGKGSTIAISDPAAGRVSLRAVGTAERNTWCWQSVK